MSEDLLSRGEVFRFEFQMHHAPQYVMEVGNGAYCVTEAHVEFTGSTDPYVWGTSRDKIVEYLSADHVEVDVVDWEDSPFSK